jgi:hypothetical protein
VLVSNSCTTNPKILASYGQYEDTDLTVYLSVLGEQLGAVCGGKGSAAFLE